MCDGGEHDHDHEHDHRAEAQAAMPRSIDGRAVDPIHLEPVDEVVVTTLVDNSYDGLLTDGPHVRRVGMARTPRVPTWPFTGGDTVTGLAAEHGFSALITTRRGDRTHTLLFDTGISPDGLARNAERLGIDTSAIEGVVLSHNHFDHAGGFEGLARLRRRSGLPITVHPLVWTPRRVAVPGQPAWEFPTLNRRALENEGFTVIERRQPSLLLDRTVLITGEVDRTTDFETGMRHHEMLGPKGWEPDPLIMDDQAIIVNVRDRGLVVITGCGHAGAVNICRYAMRLTEVPKLASLMGGLHLAGPVFEPVIEPTIQALRLMDPMLVVPAHCTGWKAQHRLAALLPEAFVPNAVGSRFTIAA